MKYPSSHFHVQYSFLQKFDSILEDSNSESRDNLKQVAAEDLIDFGLKNVMAYDLVEYGMIPVTLNFLTKVAVGFSTTKYSRNLLDDLQFLYRILEEPKN